MDLRILNNGTTCDAGFRQSSLTTCLNERRLWCIKHTWSVSQLLRYWRFKRFMAYACIYYGQELTNKPSSAFVGGTDIYRGYWQSHPDRRTKRRIYRDSTAIYVDEALIDNKRATSRESTTTMDARERRFPAPSTSLHRPPTVSTT